MDEVQPHNYLDDIWTYYFHDPEDPDWNTMSYKRLIDISSVEDYASARSCLRGKVPRGMFFLMREHVFPCWDDKYNIDGGCLCIRIPKHAVETFWDEICLRLIGELLLLPVAPGDDKRMSSMDCVNGASVSPKTYYAIVKIWVSRDIDPVRLDLPVGFQGEVMYKPNREFIHACQTSKAPLSGHPVPVRRDKT
jgi:hypothetical protein